MCGISGIIHFDTEHPVDAAVLSSMNQAMAHRGPDDHGEFLERNVGLGHRRLAIIDPASGHQPVTNEDGSLWIVFNGEIYNFIELKESLVSQGHMFKTNCDTEVLVHLYEQYGTKCLDRLNGMFAFAIYNKKNGELFLARDRLGQKPLVYFKTSKCFVFASELNALKQHPEMPTELDLQSIHDYLTLQYVPLPKTIFKGVCKLPPAHFMKINIQKQSCQLDRYWALDYQHKTVMDFDDAKSQLRELLQDAVKKRMISDVPLGAFLSGGIDSTLVVSLMAQISDLPVKAYTIGFHEENYDERKFAATVVSYLNKKNNASVEHCEQLVDPADFSVVEKLIYHYGEPFCDASMLPTFLLSKFTREHVTVAISGDGADELFAGYYRYLVMKFSRIVDVLPLSVRKMLGKNLLKYMPSSIEERTLIGKLQRLVKMSTSSRNERYLSIVNRCDEALKKNLYGQRFNNFTPHETQSFINAFYSITTAESTVEKIMETDIYSYLPGDILTKVDIASMATSLEVRSAFMDHRLAEFAASLPLSFKQHNTTRKYILKEAFKDIIPNEIFSRKKLGFGVPIASWFRKKWDQPLRDNLLNGICVNEGYFNKKTIETLVKDHQSMKADWSYALWAILIFELFLKQLKSG